MDITSIVALLEKFSVVSKVEILTIDEIEKRGFYKVRCLLIPSKFKLDIKFIKTEKEILYSYQLYAHKAIARWDNEPHYPDIDNYPHHYHCSKNKVTASQLSGNPEKDIRKIFSLIPKLLSE